MMAKSAYAEECQEMKNWDWRPCPSSSMPLTKSTCSVHCFSCCFDHLKTYLKSLEGNISNFLRFVTGSDIVNYSTIKVRFSKLDVAHICGPVLELPRNYQSYNELVEEFSCILSGKCNLKWLQDSRDPLRLRSLRSPSKRKCTRCTYVYMVRTKRQ